MCDPLILVCLPGVYATGEVESDGTYPVTNDLTKAGRFSKTQLDHIFSVFTDMKNLFDVFRLSELNHKP